MIGSPNYGLYVTNGTQAQGKAQAPSTKLQRLFEDFIKKDKGLDCMAINMSYPSDHRSFWEANISTVLIHGGAEETKSIEQRAMFGGEAGAPMDACVDSPCDDTFNINKDAVVTMCK